MSSPWNLGSGSLLTPPDDRPLGRGILDDCTPEELMRIELRRQEEEYRAVQEEASHRAADALEARQQAKLDWIQKELLPQLKDMLEIESKNSRIDDERRALWDEFVNFASEHELPSLPAPPELICAFLLEKFDENEPETS